MMVVAAHIQLTMKKKIEGRRNISRNVSKLVHMLTNSIRRLCLQCIVSPMMVRKLYIRLLYVCVFVYLPAESDATHIEDNNRADCGCESTTKDLWATKIYGEI